MFPRTLPWIWALILCACAPRPSAIDNDGDGVSVVEDCDDLRADVNPLAVEVCGDGVDNDCDGIAGACPLSGEVPYTDAQVLVASPVDSRTYDRGADVGDVNGDGFSDLVFAPAYGASVYVFTGPVTASSTEERSAEITHAVEGTFLVEGADLMNDGTHEIIVSVGGEDWGAGGVYIYREFSESMAPENAAVVLSGTGDGWTGARFLDTCQLTEDSAPYLLLSEPWADENGEDSGSVMLLEGDTDAAALNLNALETQWLGTADTDFLGFSGSCGDLDGDGLDEVLLGAPNGGANGHGVAYIVEPMLGVMDAIENVARVRLDQNDDVQGYGASVSLAGDVDGDGTRDVLIGGPGSIDPSSTGHHPGLVTLFTSVGTTALLPGNAHTQFTSDTDSLLGWQVDASRDVDGDGRAEVLLSDPHYPSEENPGQDVGRAFVFYSAGEGGTFDVSEADFAVYGMERDDYVGVRASFGGDLLGDGSSTMILGVSGDDTLGSSHGALAVFGLGTP